MEKLLFPRFLVDPSEYRAAQKHWESLVEKAAKDLGQQGEWIPWMVKAFADGTPVPLDGNPIIEVRSSRLHRAFRVIQFPPESDGPVVMAYLDRVGGGDLGEISASDELVITTALSEGTSSIADKLIRLWMSVGTTRDEMEDAVRKLTVVT
jgi:hypothetical protein